MTTLGRMTIPAGARGFDALGDPSDPTRLGRDGWRFRTFYCAPRSQYSTKITDANRDTTARQRINAHIGAGLGVLLNFETSNDRPTSGRDGGRADGAWTRGLCEDLGYPEGVPLLVSFDYETRVNGWPSGDAVAYGH